MSKIVYWSPLHGQCQTSNLHITGLIMSLFFKKRILMMQTQFSMNNLESPLIGKKSDINSKEASSIFQEIGLDAAVMYSRMNLLNGDTLERCCMTFPGTSLLLLPGTETKNRETFNRDTLSSVCSMIHQAEDLVDLVMIDANCGNDELSFKLMASADIIIVNLTQHRYVLNKFFSEYGDKFAAKDNVFYILGKYDKKSGYNITNCRRKYKQFIDKSNSGLIPYCTKYMDALNECNILRMVKEGLHINKKLVNSKFKFNLNTQEETDYFFSQSHGSTAKILNMLSLAEGKAFARRSGA